MSNIVHRGPRSKRKKKGAKRARSTTYRRLLVAEEPNPEQETEEAGPGAPEPAGWGK